MSEQSRLRQVYYEAWQKFQAKAPLSSLETIIVEVIKMHPEYQPIFEINNFNQLQDQQFSPDDNPFLHLSLHVSLHEQLQADRPRGIRTIYQQYLAKYTNLQAEHEMIACLTHYLQNCMATQSFDEARYLQLLQHHLTLR